MAGLTFNKGDVINGRFEVHGILGKGGFGEVYLVYDLTVREVYALKTIGSEYLADPRSKQAFKKEALLWVNLDEHPFILAARWVDEFSGRPYVVMDHIAPDAWGRVSLSDHLANPHGSLDMDRSMSWAIEFCHGMEHAIRRGMRSHRDIKPSNILLTQDRTLKISDFGLAKGAEAAWGQGTGPFVMGAGGGAFGLSLLKSDGKGVCGTPGYIAPEVIRGDGADVRSDIYSFGIVLWQMATGSPVPPFHSPVQQDVNEYVREVYQQQMRGRVPAGGGQLREAIERCLSPEPLRRYKDFEHLRNDIENLFRKRTGRVIELPPAAENNDDFWNNKGASLYALGRHEDAINCFDKAIEINPHGAAAWNNRGNPLMSLGRHEEALACYSKALEINPQVPRSAMIWPPHCLANKGRALCALGRDEEALACYSKALTIDPQQAAVWNNKGVLLCALGRYQEALTCCGKATEIDPQSSFAWDNMGRALHGLGRSEEAIECFSKALQIDPQSTGSCFQIGLILSELNRHEQAIHWYSKALEIDQQNAEAWVNKGLSLRDLGRMKDAIVCFTKALGINPRDVAAYIGMGAVLGDLGQQEEALTCYVKAVELDPRVADAWMNKGLTLVALGRPNDARDCFAKVVDINPRDTGAWIQKAHVEELCGDRQAAASSLRRFLDVARGIPERSDGVLVAENWLRELEQAHRATSSVSETMGARFKLSKVETTYIFASFLLSGRWEDLSVSEDEAREWVWQFIGGMNDHGPKVVKRLFIGMQNTLMAHRKDSFERIQQEPFFSLFSLRNTMQLDAAWVAAGDDGFRAEWKQIFTPGWKEGTPVHRSISITGGPGNSAETAFILINAPDVETRIAAELRASTA